MPFENDNREIEHPIHLSNAGVGGIILILIGVFCLAAQSLGLSAVLILGGLGALFLVWALLVRTTALLVPGGVLTGIAAGLALLHSPLIPQIENGRGGLFLLGMAGGWGLISLLSLFTASHGRWAAWPLIPGGVLALIGVALISDGIWLQALGLVGRGWPLLLIAIGMYVVLRQKELAE